LRRRPGERLREKSRTTHREETFGRKLKEKMTGWRTRRKRRRRKKKKRRQKAEGRRQKAEGWAPQMLLPAPERSGR
jgi:hypothetical protein